jgi:Spy/CpxP family protein refolding chaperone
MKNLFVTLSAVIIALILTVPAFAMGHHGGRGDCPGWKNFDQEGCGGNCGKYLFKKLNLTDEQKTKFDALQLTHKNEVKPIREKMFDKSAELRKLWLQVNPAKETINAKQKEVRLLRDQLEDKRTEFRLEINKLLTAEQKEKLAALGWDKKPGFGPRGGKRCGGESGPGMCF